MISHIEKRLSPCAVHADRGEIARPHDALRAKRVKGPGEIRRKLRERIVGRAKDPRRVAPFQKYVREFRERQHVFVFFDLMRQAAVVDDDPQVRKSFEIGDEELGVAWAQDEYRKTVSHGRTEEIYASQVCKVLDFACASGLQTQRPSVRR